MSNNKKKYKGETVPSRTERRHPERFKKDLDKPPADISQLKPPPIKVNIQFGHQMIAKERMAQVLKHKKTTAHDLQFNGDCQLGTAACTLAWQSIEDFDTRNTPPNGWDLEQWQKMYDKPYKERLVIAGALIAAEIDRLQQIDKNIKTLKK